ncbi:DEAD/DEAH box helicase [Tannockella kyphosi]|uniref:DEAD/DEAH box helicase n=1 Tax=Tannockella kyphosi TaxID=2899121 RepID=UPI00201366AE|nr:DEAD/DEAH box helicase [Tannockella kyphosi]
MQCPRCKNEDNRYFYLFQNRYYCRKCIRFGRVFVDQQIQVSNHTYETTGHYQLNYQLTKQQKDMSKQLVLQYQNYLDSKVKAVCGAGKTEIVYEVIQYALSLGRRVCFCTPRRELTKELFGRLKEQFFDVGIDLVYGGHTKKLEGQLIVCTCHQLFRFPQCFDLLVLDEMDAFPYKGDEQLQEILKNSCKGNMIYMSATMQDEDALSMAKRYHGHDIPVPKCQIMPYYFSLLKCVQQIKQYCLNEKPVLIYVATKQQTLYVANFLKLFHVKTDIVHSLIPNTQELLRKLINREVDCLVTTTILERGVTIENVQVLILSGENKVYDRETLIQIAGRVGRKIGHPTGDVIIYSVYKTKAIKDCIRCIITDNAAIV